MGVYHSATGGYGIYLTGDQVIQIVRDNKDKIEPKPPYNSVDDLLEDGAYECIEALVRNTGLEYVPTGSSAYGGDGGFVVGSCWSVDMDEEVERISELDLEDTREKVLAFMDKFEFTSDVAVWAGVYVY